MSSDMGSVPDPKEELYVCCN